MFVAKGIPIFATIKSSKQPACKENYENLLLNVTEKQRLRTAYVMKLKIERDPGKVNELNYYTFVRFKTLLPNWNNSRTAIYLMWYLASTTQVSSHLHAWHLHFRPFHTIKCQLHVILERESKKTKSSKAKPDLCCLWWNHCLFQDSARRKKPTEISEEDNKIQFILWII